MSTSSRLERLQTVLSQLARSGAWSDPEASAALDMLVRRTTETLQLRRAGVWLWDEDEQVLRLEVAYDTLRGLVREPIILTRRDYPAYFEAILGGSLVAAGDAVQDPRTSELAETYLIPAGIGALLDAPIYLRGAVRGVVCHEAEGGARVWHEAEASFASSIADLVSLALETLARRRAEAQLESQSALAQLAMGAVGMAAWSWNIQTDQISWDPGVADLLGEAPGWSPAGLQALTERTHPDDVDRLQQAIAASMSRPDEDYNIEYRVRHKDGHYVVNRGRGRWRLAPDGTPVELVGLVWDATEEVQVRAELERTQRAESLARLAAGVAHDFNNILGSVLAASELMTVSSDPVQRQRLGRTVQVATERAGRLTRQLMTFARGHDDDLVPHDVRGVVHRVAELASPMLGAAIGIAVDVGAHPLYAKVSESGLEQVLLNLVLNARDAIGEASGQVRMACRLEGERVLLSVADDGEGMDIEVQRRLFEPFFTTRQGDARGLGLSTSFGIVQRFDGVMTVVSTLGAGSTLCVSLPHWTGPVEVPASVVEESEQAAPQLPATVLMVEDEVILLELLEEVLSDSGYLVYTATCVRQAKACLASLPDGPTVLVTDQRLPDGTGTALARLVAARHPEVGVIFMTGYTDEGFPQVGRSSTTLVKPFRPKALLRAVRSMELTEL